MDNNQLPPLANNQTAQTAQNPQYSQYPQNMQYAQVPQQPEKSHKKLLAIVIAVAIIIVAAAVVLIAASTRQQATPTTTDEEKKPQEEKPGEVVGFDPGHPLPDDDKLDKDNSKEYTDALKVYIKLDKPMSYSELEEFVKGISSSCKVSQKYDLGTIYCNGSDRINFNIEEKNNTKTASYFNYSNSFKEEVVVFIRDLGDGRYEFGNDALLGTYSNKNRAINAYLYYITQYEKYSVKTKDGDEKQYDYAHEKVENTSCSIRNIRVVMLRNAD